MGNSADLDPASITTSAHRSAAIDVVRVVGITAIVLGHTWGDGARWVFPWHVPLFFILTGYLWTPGRTLAREWSRRWPTLGVPYVAWLVVITAVLVVDGVVRGHLPLHVIAGGVWGGCLAAAPYTTLWFFAALLLVAVGYRYVERWPVGLQVAVACAGVAAGYVVGNSVAKAPLSIGLAFMSFGFVLVGRAFRESRTRFRFPVVTGALLILGSIAILLVSTSTFDLKSGDLGTPIIGFAVACAIPMGLILIAEALAPRIGAAGASVATLLATAGVFVILAHPVVIFSVDPTGRSLAFIVLVYVALPWALAIVVQRTRLAGVFIG